MERAEVVTEDCGATAAVHSSIAGGFAAAEKKEKGKERESERRRQAKERSGPLLAGERAASESRSARARGPLNLRSESFYYTTGLTLLFLPNGPRRVVS